MPPRVIGVWVGVVIIDRISVELWLGGVSVDSVVGVSLVPRPSGEMGCSGTVKQEHCVNYDMTLQ